MGQYLDQDNLLYEANLIVERAARYREAGESFLVDRAWAYSNAALARQSAGQNLAVAKGARLYKTPLTTALEQATAKEAAERDAFVKALKSAREVEK
jgi:hypothetical protein